MKCPVLFLLSLLLCAACDIPKLQLPISDQWFEKQQFDSVYVVYQELLGMESFTWSLQRTSVDDTTTVRKLTFVLMNCERIPSNSDTLQYLAERVIRDFYRILRHKNNYHQIGVRFQSEKGFILTMRNSMEYTVSAAWLEHNASATSATLFLPAVPATRASGNTGVTSATTMLPATTGSFGGNQ